MSSIFEVAFTFTPEDEFVNGEGFVTLIASSEDEARKLITEMMGDAQDLSITQVNKIADIASSVPHEAHRTLQ
jgi:hypothetical protein